MKQALQFRPPKSIKKPLHEVYKITKQSFGILKQNPQIASYPYIAVLFISLTLPLANGLIFTIWSHFGHSTIFSLANATPHRLRLLLGLVTFSAFYAALLSAYFTCATSAAVQNALGKGPGKPFTEFGVVGHHFFKIAAYGLLAVFFFPIGVIAQRGKLKGLRGIAEVAGSSLSLQMSQLAPAILKEKLGLFETVRLSVNTLGGAWRENLIIKAGMYGLFAVLAALSFLPKLIDHWFSGEAAHIAGWSATILLGAASYIGVKVIGTVLTTTLYFRASAGSTNKK